MVLWIGEISSNKASASELWQGGWQGMLDINPSMSLTIIIHIEADNNQLIGTLDSPDQGANGIPINSITVEKQHITISIDAIDARFQANLKNGSLDGTFSQGGQQCPLILILQSTDQASVLAEKKARPQEPKAPYPYVEELVKYPHPSGEFSFAGT
ncbi:hypothetical protein QX776_08690 [Alteromonadaceae bacterium BrNp21-10]|nr:hypothetical protein [Alteromonadaceae bacterium BrNp21-10]